ncbi:MAG: lysylphosphatidylglycerol synthase transmembrane domain-containing protein [Paracoccaceae bacterium]|nr:lysylphosphatidylglycerol synthase transmembrane domain-containing protein [Paracoccaceae bacterium]
MMPFLLKLSVSLAIVGALMWWADARAVANRLQDADILWLCIAFATLTALTVLMARRWQIVADALGIKLSFGHALAEYYLAQLANLALPGGVLGDVSRAYRIRKKLDLARAAQSVAAERLIGQIFMFTLTTIAFICALIMPGGMAWSKWAWLGVCAVVLVAALAIATTRFQTATSRFLQLCVDLSRQPRLIALSLLIAILLIFSFYACARATHTIIRSDAWFTVIPLILCSMLIPLSVGGWGWREGAAAALFPLIGADPSAGIAAGIAYGAVMTLAALPAVLIWLKAPDPIPYPQNSKMDLL